MVGWQNFVLQAPIGPLEVVVSLLRHTWPVLFGGTVIWFEWYLELLWNFKGLSSNILLFCSLRHSSMVPGQWGHWWGQLDRLSQKPWDLWGYWFRAQNRMGRARYAVFLYRWGQKKGSFEKKGWFLVNLVSPRLISEQNDCSLLLTH